MCYIIKSRASRLKEVIYFIYLWSNIWNSVSCFGLSYTKKMLTNWRGALKEHITWGEAVFTWGFSLFSLRRRRLRLGKVLVVVVLNFEWISVEKRAWPHRCTMKGQKAANTRCDVGNSSWIQGKAVFTVAKHWIKLLKEAEKPPSLKIFWNLNKAQSNLI